jgi:RHS repeat-associated protein
MRPIWLAAAYDCRDRLSYSLGDQMLAEHSYAGVNMPVIVDYVDPRMKYDLAISDGMGDKYTGLDRFGRVFNNLWQNYNSTPISAVELHYGYDRASNRLWREDTVAKAQTPPQYFDERYTYVGLYRLTEMQRGQLTGSPPAGVTNKNFQQDWTLDKTGNWQGFTEAATGGSNTLVQSRTANPVNEITDITNTTGDAWTQPGYDAAGNMTTIPQPADMTKSYVATYDAWNRLRKLFDAATGAPVQENVYDGLQRRVIRKNYDSGNLTETRHFYYSDLWQTLEERVIGAPYSPDRQFVWGLRQIDDLVLRDRSATGTLNQRLFSLQDGNWNIVALADTSGAVQQRVAYAAYGMLLFLNASFVASSNSKDWETRVCGYRWDILTELFYVRFRYLNAALGVWNVNDLIGYLGGDPNTKQYSFLNPTTGIDPLGLLSILPNVPAKSIDPLPGTRTATQDDPLCTAAETDFIATETLNRAKTLFAPMLSVDAEVVVSETNCTSPDQMCNSNPGGPDSYHVNVTIRSWFPFPPKRAAPPPAPTFDPNILQLLTQAAHSLNNQMNAPPAHVTLIAPATCYIHQWGSNMLGGLIAGVQLPIIYAYLHCFLNCDNECKCKGTREHARLLIGNMKPILLDWQVDVTESSQCAVDGCGATMALGQHLK